MFWGREPISNHFGYTGRAASSLYRLGWLQCSSGMWNSALQCRDSYGVPGRLHLPCSVAFASGVFQEPSSSCSLHRLWLCCGWCGGAGCCKRDNRTTASRRPMSLAFTERACWALPRGMRVSRFNHKLLGKIFSCSQWCSQAMGSLGLGCHCLLCEDLLFFPIKLLDIHFNVLRISSLFC